MPMFEDGTSKGENLKREVAGCVRKDAKGKGDPTRAEKKMKGYKEDTRLFTGTGKHGRERHEETKKTGERKSILN